MRYLLAQFRNALKHVLSVKHMNACVEARTEAGSQNALCWTNRTNPFWKLTRIRAAQSFEQISSLFPLAPENDSVFLGRLLFCRTKHLQGVQGGGQAVGCVKREPPAKPSPRGSRSIHPALAQGHCGRQQLHHPHKRKRGLWLGCFFFFFYIYYYFSPPSCNFQRLI